jgi:hypothetical protein
MKNKKGRHWFWVGFGVSVFYNSFTQDLLGKDKYLEAVGLLWVNSSPWIWPFLILSACLLGVAVEWAES